MKKLKLDNFKIAELSNPHFIKGGNGGDDGGNETGTMECVETSNKWVKRKNGTVDIDDENDY